MVQRRIKSKFVRTLLQNAGVTDDGPQDGWPKVLEVTSTVIEKAHEQGILTNGHVMAHAGGLVHFAMQFCPEVDRARVLKDYFEGLRDEILPIKPIPDPDVDRVAAFKAIEQNNLNVGKVHADVAGDGNMIRVWAVSYPVRNGLTDWYYSKDLIEAVFTCLRAPKPAGAE